MDSNLDNIITSWLNYYIKFHNYASISLGVSNGTQSFVKTFGKYDKVQQIASPFYNIASLSKLYTVVEMLKLVDNGVIKLKDKITDHLDYFPSKEISIEDLLAFKVDIPRDGYFNFWLTEQFPSEEELQDQIKSLNLTKAETFKYSNLSYAIVGLILKKFITIDQQERQDVIGFGKPIFGKIKQFGPVNYKSFTPAMGLNKTIEEMSAFGQILLNKDTALLSHESWEILLKVHLALDGDQDDVTLALRKWKGSNIYEIPGYGFGFASGLLLDYDNQNVFTVLTNSANEEFALYFLRTIRRLMEYFGGSKTIDLSSKLNGYYRGKDYDICVYDCTNSLYIFKPYDTTPFHEDNFEEFTKNGENSYLISNREDDPYQNEIASFQFDEQGNVAGFTHGGWGFVKFTPELS